MSGPKRLRGFTLIEMMIVVAIVGVLAAIALPSYFSTSPTREDHRGDTGLSDLRQRMEQKFLDNRTYADTPTRRARSSPPR